MDAAAFTNPSGELVTQRRHGGGQDLTFVPNPLPPPPEIAHAAIASAGALLADAEYWLGQLIGLGGVLHDANALAAPYIRHEAVRSSQIEGTRTSLGELVAFEAASDEPPPDDDARETLNYVAALDEGLSRIRDGGAIDAALLRDLHRTLMAGAGNELRSAPGEFRDVQAYITGGGRVIYTPPAPDRMPGCLDDLFRYIDSQPEAPPLVEIAWVHYAFEAIHPFRDGNGRVGRILMPLLLARRRGLEHPLLYLSPYLFEHRQEYYDRLFAVSARSDWAGWLAFMLRAVASRARASVATAQRLIAIEDEWRQRLEEAGATPTALRLAVLIRRQSLAVTAPRAIGLLAGAGSAVTPPTAYQAIADLERAGIVSEITGRARGRIWLARELVDLLESDEGAANEGGAGS
ncbi:MAG: Fic family protein [Chloroflexi bacterium]|nr:Fic family protein [Chloroflexota bacterium]